ncbi:MAG: protein kinase [Cyanobacteria bacterium HKST-UBA02]|nr:protein kinase [Cyanobacteria bacterium HKST-UBA02]
MSESSLAGRYIILGELGSGGMGRVYHARDSRMDREVAVKVLLREGADDSYLTRFQREAKAISSLDHPSIVRVLDFGLTEDNDPFMVLDLVPGRGLDGYAKEHAPLDAETVIDLTGRIADAMQHAHKNGVIHRDLKPSNIMVQEEGDTLRPLILDFGIAKIDSGSEGIKTLTRTGQMIGSPRYMSPEQARGERPDGRSDIYSLACMAFELLTGKPVFEGDTAFETIEMHLNKRAPSLSESNQSLEFDPRLERVIARALLKNREDRFETMSEFKEALDECKQAVPADTIEPGGKQKNTLGPVLIGTVVFAAALFPVLGILFMDSTDKSIYQPEKAEHKGALSPKSSEIADNNFESALNSRLGNKYGEDHCLRLDGEEVEAGLPGGDEKIQIVWLSNCSVDKKRIDKISLYPNINRIYLEKCRLGPGTLRHLAKLSGKQDRPFLRGLMKLWLVECELTSEDLATIATMKNLEQLKLSRNKGLTARALGRLALLPRLRTLTMNSCAIDDRDMEALATIPSLEHLYVIDNPDISEEGLKPFQNRRRLAIYVEDNDAFSESNLKRLQKKFGVNIYIDQRSPLPSI